MVNEYNSKQVKSLINQAREQAKQEIAKEILDRIEALIEYHNDLENWDFVTDLKKLKKEVNTQNLRSGASNGVEGNGTKRD